MIDSGWPSWWVVPMMLCMAILLAAIIGVLVAVTRSGVLPHQRTPEELLRERFARGEIDSAEYRDWLDALHEQRFTTSY